MQEKDSDVGLLMQTVVSSHKDKPVTFQFSEIYYWSWLFAETPYNVLHIIFQSYFAKNKKFPSESADLLMISVDTSACSNFL